MCQALQFVHAVGEHLTISELVGGPRTRRWHPDNWPDFALPRLSIHVAFYDRISRLEIVGIKSLDN